MISDLVRKSSALMPLKLFITLTITIWVIGGIFFFIVSKKFFSNTNFYKSEISAVVVDINDSCYEINNKCFFIKNEELRNVLSRGDSIYKSRNSSILLVYEKQTNKIKFRLEVNSFDFKQLKRKRHK